MDLLRIIIIGLLLIALPLGEVARVTFNEAAVTLLDIGVGIIVLTWFILKRRIPQSNLFRPIAIFIASLIISLLINLTNLSINELLVSSLYLLRWVFYALLYFVVLDLRSFRQKIERTMLIGGAIIVTVGYVQYFLYPDLRNLFYAGWDEHLFRMFTWTFLDPNFAGMFFVLYFLFLLGRFFKNPSLILKFLSIATLVAIILTFSRSAYIALVVGVISLLFLKGKKLLGIGLVILFIINALIIVGLSSKSEGTDLLRTASSEARLDSMKNALTIFKDHAIFGVGFNSYRYAQRDYGFLIERRMIVHSGAGTDNSFLFILAASGLIGLITFLYLWLKILLIKEPLIIASSLALFVNSFFLNSFFYPPIMLWMFTLIGILSSDGRFKENK